MIKKLPFLLIFGFFLSCSSGKEQLVDLEAFINQGQKINIITQKDLTNTDINKIKNLKKVENFKYNKWQQYNYNNQNLVLPTNVRIEKKLLSISGNFQKIVSINNLIIAINNKSEIIIFDSDLKKKNSRKLYKKKVYKNYAIKSDLVIYKNKIFISNNLGDIHCLDLKDLKVLWSKKLSVPFKSNIKIYKDNIYLLNTNSKIFSINVKSGNINFSFETGSRSIKNEKSYQIAIHNDKLIFTNDSGEIYCLDLKENNILWSISLNIQNFIATSVTFASSPIVVDNDGNLYFSTNYGYTYKINSNNGSVKWAKPIKSTNRLLLVEKYLMMVVSDRLIILNKFDGNLLLNKKINFTKKNKNYSILNFVVGRDFIYLFEKNGFLASLDIKNLDKIKIQKFTNGHIDYLVNDSNLFILSNNSIVKY